MTFNSFKVYRQNFFEYCRLVLKMGGKIFWHCSKNCWIDVKIVESQWLLKCCLRTFICYNYLSNFFEVFWAFLNILLIVESKWWFNSNWEKVHARKCWSMCCVCGGEAYAACTVVRHMLRVRWWGVDYCTQAVCAAPALPVTAAASGRQDGVIRKQCLQ